MHPFLLVNWRAVNRRFCGLVWLVALVLALVIIGHAARTSSPCVGKRTFRGGGTCAASAVPEVPAAARR